jgi:outer membrane protein
MMKRKRISIVVIFAFLFTCGSAAWAEKIGYFDYKTVIDKSKWGQQSMKKLEQKQKALKAKVDREAQQFKKLKEEFDKKRTMLDEKALTNKLKQLQAAKKEGEKVALESGAELRKLEDQLSAPFSKKVAEVVTQIAKKKKYDFVFEVRTAGLFYGDPKHDLTNDIIKELDRSKPR